MDGLTEQADSGVVFDKPDGRIVERYASGPLTTDSVVAFYKETLPQLGWQAKPDKRANHLAFEREGESLDIEFKKVDLGTRGAVLGRTRLSRFGGDPRC